MVSILKNDMKFLLLCVVFVATQSVLRADEFSVEDEFGVEVDSDVEVDPWVDRVDTTEEDLIVIRLQGGAAVDNKADPAFVQFLADIGGRLTLKQTYQSALSDLLMSVRNDQMWKNYPAVRSIMLSLLHSAEVNGRRGGGADLPAVDQIVREAFELWPPGPDRTRIVGLMNSLSSFQERRVMLAQAAQDKADAAAAREVARVQAAQERADMQVARDAAAVKSVATVVSKPPKIPKASLGRGRKPKATSSQDAVNASEDSVVASSVVLDASATRSPRKRGKAAAAQEVVAPVAQVPPAPVVDVPERIDHLPVISAPAQVVEPSVVPVADSDAALEE